MENSVSFQPKTANLTPLLAGRFKMSLPSVLGVKVLVNVPKDRGTACPMREGVHALRSCPREP